MGKTMKQKKSKCDDNKIVKLAEKTKDVRAEMVELVERALEGAANLITLSESMTRGEKEELSRQWKTSGVIKFNHFQV